MTAYSFDNGFLFAFLWLVSSKVQCSGSTLLIQKADTQNITYL